MDTKCDFRTPIRVRIRVRVGPTLDFSETLASESAIWLAGGHSDSPPVRVKVKVRFKVRVRSAV